MHMQILKMKMKSGTMLETATKGKSTHKSGLEILPPFFPLTHLSRPTKEGAPPFLSAKNPNSL